MIHWVFTFTEAEVISDPDFQAIERIVREHVMQEQADLRAEVEALPSPLYSLDINGEQRLVGGMDGVIRRSDVVALLNGGGG